MFYNVDIRIALNTVIFSVKKKTRAKMLGLQIHRPGTQQSPGTDLAQAVALERQH